MQVNFWAAMVKKTVKRYRNIFVTDYTNDS